MSQQSRAMNLDLATVGFAVFLALGSTGAWGLVTLASLAGMDAADVAVFENLRSAGFLFVLFSFGLGCLFKPRLFKRDTTRASTAVWAAGYALLFAAAFGAGRGWSLAAGSVFLGAGHGLSFIVWQRLFAAMDFHDACRKIVVASMAGGAAYFAMSLCGSAPLYGAVVAILLAVNAGTLLALGPTPRVREASGADAPSRDNSNQFRGFAGSVWRYVVCVAVIGYVNGLARVVCRVDGPDDILLNAVLAAGMVVAAMLLLLAWETFGQAAQTKTPYTPVLLGVMTGFIALPFFGPSYRLFFAGFSSAAFNMVSMFMMFTSIRVAKSRDLDPIATFGLFAGSVYLCVLVGRVVGGLLDVSSGDFSQVLVVALLSLYALALSAAATGKFKAGTGTGSDDPETAPPSGETPGGEAAFDGVREVVVMRDMTAEYCRSLRKRYGLTNRESDVLELILRGQYVPQMAEALCVSENTVRSHCKTLYKKLGVHSRRQLFDLVETVR